MAKGRAVAPAVAIKGDAVTVAGKTIRFETTKGRLVLHTPNAMRPNARNSSLNPADRQPKTQGSPMNPILLSFLTSSFLLGAAMVAVSAGLGCYGPSAAIINGLICIPTPGALTFYRQDNGELAGALPEAAGPAQGIFASAFAAEDLGASLGIDGKTISFDAASERIVCK